MEMDMSAELEKDNVEYERTHKKNISLSALNEKTGKWVSLKRGQKGWHGESKRHSLVQKKKSRFVRLLPVENTIRHEDIDEIRFDDSGKTGRIYLRPRENKEVIDFKVE